MFGLRIIDSMLLWMVCVGIANSGEIIISPVAKEKVISPANNDKNLPNEATVLRNKAHAYKSENAPSVPLSGVPVIIQMDVAPEIEEGVLLPRDDGISPTFRTKSRNSLRDSIPVTEGIQSSDNDAASADRQDTRMQLEKNRFKASQYMKGSPAPNLMPHRNDSQVVACDSTGNVSGRIGDDSVSGREIVVIREGKQVKMRCK